MGQLSIELDTFLNWRRTLNTAFLTTNDDGLQELIVLILRVAVLDSLERVGAVLTLPSNQTLHTNLDTLPALVTVHDVVTANDSGNITKANLLGLVKQLLHVQNGALGVGITTVAEEVNEDLGDLHLLGEVEQSEQMSDVGVDTTV